MELHYDPGILDFTNNNNSGSEKERGQAYEMMTSQPESPETSDEHLSAECSVTGASPLTPDSSPHDSILSFVDEIHNPLTSTPPKQDIAYLPRCQLANADRGASDSGTQSNHCFSEAAIYQHYASMTTSPFLSTPGGSSPMRGVGGAVGGAVRCPPVREAVDPAKYITISGEPDGVKYACSKCGNIYKWRKSLNKHWKEKHDGELPDPVAVSAAASRYARMPPTLVATKGPSPTSLSCARPLSSVTRPTGVRGSLAAILSPQSGGSLSVAHSPLNSRAWNQSGASTSPHLRTPTFADYHSPSGVTASPFSILAADSVSNKERPVDLSGSTSRTQNDDEGVECGNGTVLDLSKKGGATSYVSQSSSVQDEPIDFSTKTGLRSAKKTTYDVGFHQTTFARRQLEVAHAGAVAATTSLNCAQCRQKFSVPSKLNRHFADVHSDMLHMSAAVTAGDAAAGELSCGGSTQLYRYLMTEQSAATGTEAIRCIVCGVPFFWKSAAAKHFDQEHVGLKPNPYKLGVETANVGSSTQRRATSVVGVGSDVFQQLPGAGNHLGCDRCPFTTDSFSVLARHHLRHSPRRPNDLVTPDMNRILWGGTSSGGAAAAVDTKVAELQLLSGTTVNMDDVIGENTAIVIPQAPEDSAPHAVAASTSKPFKHTSSSGGRSSGGRGKRSEVGGSSTASAEILLPFKCELCEYRARWPSEMTQHAKNHSDEKPYHCPQCTYRSKWKWDVVKHLKRCGGGGTARDVIDTTQLSSTSSSSMVTGAVSAAAVNSQAARRRRNVRSLLIDVPSVYPPPSSHAGGPPRTVTETSNQPTGVASTLSSSREHLSNGPPNVVIYPRVQDAPGSERTQPHGSVQLGADAVTATVQSKPASDTVSSCPPVVSLVNQGLHYCLQCSFVGHSPAELRRHLRVHSDEKPYSCRTCCYSSKWKCDLKKHLRAYNHVSAVPLAYGGHGRKPSSDWQALKQNDAIDDDEIGPVDHVDPADTDATLDSGCQPGTVSALKDVVLAKTQRIPNGRSFAGITVGGRLPCSRCDFEAIDLTSFLQHKTTHAPARKGDISGDVEDQQGTQSSATAVSKPSHHRRKSLKQVRVPQDCKTDKCVRNSTDINMEHAKLLDEDQADVQDAVDGSKFWASLGLRSKNKVSCLQSEGMMNVVADVTADSRQEEQHTAVTDGTAVGGDSDRGTGKIGVETATPSPASSSSSATDVELIDVDQPVDLCRRRASPCVTEMATESASLYAAQQMSSAAERVTTTEADDAAGLSKRKRKLRTCHKCGYVTDNLTTLQRHAAKHGSAGESFALTSLV